MNLEERNASKHGIRTNKFKTLKKMKEMLIRESLAMNFVAKGSVEDVACVTKANYIRIKHIKKKIKEG